MIPLWFDFTPVAKILWTHFASTLAMGNTFATYSKIFASK